MILVIDNYDSFTYNLVQYVGQLGEQTIVCRNDEVTADEVENLMPSHIIISPGPGTPDDAGVSNDVIHRFHKTVPILGVCLGHQCIGQVFGMAVVRASRPMHGKTSLVHHDGKDLFRSLPNPLVATRYHSLILQGRVPDDLEVSARTSDGEIMAVRHRLYPVMGVQFHPESILTQGGITVIQNFLASTLVQRV